MRILRARDHKRMPWKNGGGETVEIAVFPPGASVNDFDWRVSTATVAQDGAFSVFPGIDRTLSVLGGEWIELEIEGKDGVRLTRNSEPYTFAGDLPVTARLMGGTITNLNVMTRRGQFSHRVVRCNPPERLEQTDAVSFILCADQSVTVSSGNDTEVLIALDCAMFAPGETALISGAGAAFLIRFLPYS